MVRSTKSSAGSTTHGVLRCDSVLLRGDQTDDDMDLNIQGFPLLAPACVGFFFVSSSMARIQHHLVYKFICSVS